MGVTHAEGGTPAAKPAAAEGSGGTRAQAGHVGGQPRPATVPDGQTRAAMEMKDDAATQPAPLAQPQRKEPKMDATEEAGGPPQQKEAPLPAADRTGRGPLRANIPSGLTSQPSNRQASTPANRPPDIAARESSEAPDAGQPGTGTGDPRRVPSTPLPPPPPPAHGAETAGHAGAAPSTAPAHRRDAGRVGRYLRELGMPPLTLQEEGLTKGTSCPSHCPMSGAS